MKKIFLLLVSVIIAGLFLSPPRDAGAERVLTESQIKSIASTCKDVQVELDSLHSSDALMRVNLGQQYSNILTSLMSPLNSRLALNQVDTVSLVTTSVDYNETLAEFRSDYSSYESSLKRVIDMKCQQEPVRFYAAIETARKNRLVLHKTVKELSSLLLRYQKDFRTTKLSWEKSRE